jgi:ribosomal protein S27E
MRVKVNCGSCGPVAVQPQDITLLRNGPAAEALFDCPICARVGARPVAGHVVTVLIARGALEARAEADPQAPLNLVDLRRLQVSLQDDEVCLEMLRRIS